MMTGLGAFSKGQASIAETNVWQVVLLFQIPTIHSRHHDHDRHSGQYLEAFLIHTLASRA